MLPLGSSDEVDTLEECVAPRLPSSIEDVCPIIPHFKMWYLKSEMSCSQCRVLSEKNYGCKGKDSAAWLTQVISVKWLRQVSESRVDWLFC